MNSKNKRMLILGAVLGILYLLMFRYQLISAQFHEIGGLALFALVIMHIILNRKRLRSFVENFENKPLKARVQIVVDVIFGMAFLTIIGSGIAMANTLPFGFGTHSGVIKEAHTVASFVGLMAMGVHLGLNWSWVTNKLKQLVPMSRNARRGFAYTALALTLVFGVIAASQVSLTPQSGRGGRGALAQNGAVTNSTTSESGSSSSSGSADSDNTYRGQTVCPRTGATSNCSNCHNTGSSSSSNASSGQSQGGGMNPGDAPSESYGQMPPQGAPGGGRHGHDMNEQVQNEQYF